MEKHNLDRGGSAESLQQVLQVLRAIYKELQAQNTTPNEPPDMKEEYPSVRAEILQWQTLRYLTLAASVAITSGFLTFVLGRSAEGTNLPTETLGGWWVLVPIALLMFLTCAMAITWYAGNGNAKMATYLKVFYEERGEEPDPQTGHPTGVGWESRHAAFKNPRPGSPPLPRRAYIDKIFNLNQLLAIFYLLLGAGSVALPFIILGNLSLPWQSIFLLFALLPFLAILMVLFLATPAKEYAKLWRTIKAQESQEPEPSEEGELTPPRSRPLP